MVLAAATLLAVLEVTAERGADPPLRSDTSWASSLLEMEEAIARGDVMAAVRLRDETYRAAVTGRTLGGLPCRGDAVLCLGDLTQNRGAAEPDARRLYLGRALPRPQPVLAGGGAAGHGSLARLGDRSVVAQGLAIARDLAGSDPAAQARVHMVANGSTGKR